MKTVTKFYHWEPLNTRKNILVIKYLFLFFTWITFGKELTVTQPKKLMEDGRSDQIDQTRMHTKKPAHFLKTENCTNWKIRSGIILKKAF